MPHARPAARPFARTLFAIALLIGGVIAPGCAATKRGFEFGSGIGSINVMNKTDRLVRVELITFDKFGAPRTYATSILTLNGTFEHGADRDNRLRQMRAKFTIADEPHAAEVNFVQLNVPENERRDYDLRIMNGRLTARELKKGR